MEAGPKSATAEAYDRRLDALARDVAYLVERQKKTEELFTEATPILKEVLKTATRELEGIERRGYFAFGREMAKVADRVVTGFTPEDVRRLGDAVVGILETVRAMTQPEVLKVLADAAGVLSTADRAEPIGLFGMVRATSDQDVQKGMAVLMDVMRHVGRASQLAAEARAARPLATKRAKLDAVLAPKKPLGTERPKRGRASSDTATKRPAPVLAKRPAPAPAEAAPGCAVPSAPKEIAAVIDGIAFSADGHMTDAAAWSPEVATKLAAMLGIELGEAHWKVIGVARADFDATAVSPNIRRLTQLASVSTKDLYALFPKAPGRTIAKIAGLPKPAGCL